MAGVDGRHAAPPYEKDAQLGVPLRGRAQGRVSSEPSLEPRGPAEKRRWEGAGPWPAPPTSRVFSSPVPPPYMPLLLLPPLPAPPLAATTSTGSATSPASSLGCSPSGRLTPPRGGKGRDRCEGSTRRRALSGPLSLRSFSGLVAAASPTRFNCFRSSRLVARSRTWRRPRISSTPASRCTRASRRG